MPRKRKQSKGGAVLRMPMYEPKDNTPGRFNALKQYRTLPIKRAVISQSFTPNTPVVGGARRKKGNF
jgi:hypothetical protein